MRRPFRTRSAKAWSPGSRWERLESRELLSTARVAEPMFVVGPLVKDASPASGSYTPAQIQQAYQFNQVGLNGSGETIAIVDAYGDPDIQSDLNTFDTQFGLPAITVTQVSQTGTSSLPAADSTGGWELEESLDVEWAHAMAPGASITLVEASSSSTTDLLKGVTYAASHANVVSMSWGTSEFSGESSDDGDFSHAGVAFVASSGDSGAPVSWPAASPNVLAVGGTQLTLVSNGTWSSEVGWSGSGGGPSADETRPSYQSGVVTSTTMRANPDVAYDASPNTGFAVYDSDPYEGTSQGWITVGGTSAGAPQWSAILAVADQGRAAAGQAALDSTSPQQVMDILYQNPGDFHDITAGTSTGTPNYKAGPGYDYVTGLGSPMVNRVIGSLDGTLISTPIPTAPDTLVVSAPSTATAGGSFTFTVTADKAGGGVDTGYTGTIAFTSTDGQAALPGSFTFTAADDGSHTFTVTLKTAGTRTITATATAGSALAGTSAGIKVSPAAASAFVLTGFSSTATAGVAQSFTVTAKDAYGNVATGYAGKVTIGSSDPGTRLPASTTIISGSGSFTITFETAGSQSVTASATGITAATQSGISVSPAAPTNLTAAAASASQINLSWTDAAGDAGYQVQRSANGGSSWTQVGGTLAGGTTSYQDTGLSAGTTYEYRVVATGGGLVSAYSNVATATTTATVSAMTDSIWSNSYTPSENEYIWGSYELGVKFTSSEAGEVTGVRFYKQTWMGGTTHVGHLWSSTGTLLATATFTNETPSGWQQVSYSNPVAIAANTVYIVSFSSGGGYFGITSGYFSRGGVSNGPLQALSNSTPGGDGVYNSGGDFPDVGGSGMNFWVDVAFAPSAGTSVKTSTASAASPGAATSGPGGVGITAGGSSYAVVPSTAPAPTGPSSFAGVSHATTAPAAQTAAVGLASRSYLRNIPRPGTPIQWGWNGSPLLGFIDG